MKYITLSPTGIISLLLSFAILVNTASPAFAQRYIPPTSEEIEARIVANLPQRTMDGVPTTITPEREAFIQWDHEQLVGSLTEQELADLSHIKSVFFPFLGNEQENGEEDQQNHDFEIFQELYQQQIEQALAEEQRKLDQDRAALQRQINAQEADERNEIYTSLFEKITQHVLQEADPQTAADITASLAQITFDTNKDIGPQIRQFSSSHFDQEEQIALAEEIAQLAQQSAEEHAQVAAARKQERQQPLNDWYQENIQNFNQWKQETLGQAQEVFNNEYLPQLTREREAFVQHTVDSLWKYKDKSPLASSLLQQVALAIAPMTTPSGKSFFTKKQKEWLIEQYRADLKNSMNCTSVKFKKDKNTCETAFIDIAGLSLLAEDSDSANAIYDFMQAKRDTNLSVPALLTGTAALISMEQWVLLEKFLRTALQDEHDYSDVDVLSFQTYVNLAANRNGQYLGKVSQYGQYPLEDEAAPNAPAPMGNVWEDIATLLAQNGSARALDLLRRFGVEKCSIITERNISLENEQKVHCGGMIPFLAGALASGKHGADKYHLTSSLIAGPMLLANGNSRLISQEEANQAANQARQQTQQFFQYAKQAGLTPAALLARHLFLQSMGDLDADSELRLDQKMYQVFQTEMKGKTLKPEFNITSYTRNSPEFAAKRLRQDRTQAFRKIATWADVAFIAWCLFDLGRMAYKGIKLATALTKSSMMARRGATAVQRAAMFSRLNMAPQVRNSVNFPARLRAGARPAVLAQMPLYTSQSFKMPTVPGAIKSFGTLTAENLALSAQTGELLVSYQGLRAGGLTAKQAFNVKKAVQTANLTANTSFANGSRFSPRRYRRTLDGTLRTQLGAIQSEGLAATPLPTQGSPFGVPGRFTAPGKRGFKLTSQAFSPEDLAIVSSGLSALRVGIPTNILAYKTADLFKMGVVNQFGVAGAQTAVVNTDALADLMKTVYGTTPSAAKLEETAGLINQAVYQANLQYAGSHRFFRFNKSYKGIFANNLNAVFDAQGQIYRHGADYRFLQTLQAAVAKDRSLQAPTRLSKWRSLLSPTQTEKFVPLGAALLTPTASTNPNLSGQIIPQPLNIAVQADPRLSLVNKKAYQRVTFTPIVKGGQTTVQIGLDGQMLQNFKITLNAQEVPGLFRLAAQANMPLSVKITSPQKYNLSSLWNNIRQTHRVDKKTFFLRQRGELFTHEIPLSIRQADGTLQATRVTLLADTHLGWRNAHAVLDGSNISILNNGIRLNTAPLAFSLPKHQLPMFLNVVRANPSTNPFSLTFVKGKNKILPLMLANGLSLSAASSGLIVPLQNAYGDRITETDTMLISLAFPYIPALLSPVISPFVMRYGAINVLKTSLAASLTGLLLASSFGFRGYATQQDPLPPLWPLFASGIAIGISSALSRSSLNLLIDGMGGGGSLLKGMAAKNIGSFALLLPPFVANFIDKDIDFSLAFPVLSALSLGMLGWVSATRVDPAIGKVANFRLFKNKGLVKEGWSAIRLLGTREVLPLVIATTAFTGFESAAFYKAGNQLFSPTVKNFSLTQSLPESNRNNATALMTTGFIQLIPMLTRLGAKQSLNFLRNPAVIGSEYQRMLKLSYALNIAGGSLLFASGLKNDNVAMDILGLGLMGIGTANVTQSLQKLSNINVLRSRYVLRQTKGLVGAEKAIRTKAMVTKTMTGFSVSQIGLATVPLIVGRYTDRQIAEGIEKKPHAARSSLWIPLISIGLSAGFAGSAIGLLPKHLPTGLFGVTKGLFGSYRLPTQQPVPVPNLNLSNLAPGITTALPTLTLPSKTVPEEPENPSDEQVQPQGEAQ